MDALPQYILEGLEGSFATRNLLDLSGQKRARSRSPSTSPPGNDEDLLPSPQVTRPARQRRRLSNSGSTNDNPRSLVVHQVLCSRNQVGHARHQQSAFFLDQPRLFENDNRASALRGKLPMHGSLEDCLEQNPDVSLAVVRTYSCVTYHDGIKDDFVRLRLPSADPQMAAELRPYFDFLEKDSEPAQTAAESIRTSKVFQGAMEALEGYEPQVFGNWKENLLPPYLPIYHARSQVRAHIHKVLTRQQAAHVLLLLDYIEETFGQEYSEADTLFSQGLVTPEHMSKLFGPNELIVTTEEQELVAYVSTICPTPAFGSPVTLQCYNWTFDGLFRKQEKTIRVRWPVDHDGAIPILELSAYPLRFDSTGKLEEMLRKRGDVFWSCRKRNFVGYTAPTATFGIQVSHPRYVVDTLTYKELHSKEEAPTATDQNHLSEEEMDSDTPPEYPFQLLLPPKIWGFGLHDKKWRTLHVEYIRPVTWNKKAFEQLVLDPQKKELIEAMVRIHMSSTMSTDVIEGKGNGLIILLHGGPGTGKTLTAESVAELAEKPLYRVTCGDIGTDPESVERYLESVLYIGSIWKAVVLLDESDVFLEQREKTDLQRNALVSVFLRILEYYEGILILTSNRVGIFDEAFKSRVQLALHYPPLSEDDRWKIWDNFINQLDEQQEAGDSAEDESTTSKLADGEKINTKELRSKINVLARENINGRQIRNAITTARQLALHRHQPLGYAHLDQTIRVAKEFEDYVTKTQGYRAAEYVRAEGLRFE